MQASITSDWRSSSADVVDATPRSWRRTTPGDPVPVVLGEGEHGGGVTGHEAGHDRLDGELGGAGRRAKRA